MSLITHENSGDATRSAHVIKTVFGIKFSRAGQRHASAMGFSSANHLLNAIKEGTLERDFDEYIAILTKELASNHQLSVNDEVIEQLREQLV